MQGKGREFHSLLCNSSQSKFICLVSQLSLSQIFILEIMEEKLRLHPFDVISLYLETFIHIKKTNTKSIVFQILIM